MTLDARQFAGRLPSVFSWANGLTASFSGQPADTLPYRELRRCFPASLLARTRYASTPSVPVPPLEEFGISIQTGLDEGPLDGLCLGAVYFVRADAACAALHFHELVHVVQWAHLGFSRFVRTYAAGLLLHGYRDSPLEKTAYDLQLEFEHRIYRRQLTLDIRRGADLAWREARRHLPARHLGGGA